MKGLEGNADNNKDRYITNQEMFAYLKENVSQKALEIYSRDQLPGFTGSPEKSYGNINLNLKRKITKSFRAILIASFFFHLNHVNAGYGSGELNISGQALNWFIQYIQNPEE